MVRLWTSEDIPETIGLAVGLTLMMTGLWGWARVCGALIAIACTIRLVTEVAGRVLLRKRVKYTVATWFGKILVVTDIADIGPGIIDKVTQKLGEWLVDAGVAQPSGLEGSLDGTVVEIVTEPVMHWDCKACPWWLLPWDQFKWVRVTWDEKARECPELGHELMHCFMAAAGHKDPKVAHAMMEEMDFDV